MTRIVIYTTATCPYCLAAKRLLGQKHAAFEEIKVDGDRAGPRPHERIGGGADLGPADFHRWAPYRRLRRPI